MSEQATKRQAEEQALNPEELADLNRIMAGFAEGNFGFYGTRENPGLLARLDAVKMIWEYRRQQIGAYVADGPSYWSTIRLPSTQLSALGAFIQYHLDNTDQKITELCKDPGATVDETGWINEFKKVMVNQSFLQDLKKVVAKAQKAAVEKRVAEAQAAVAAAAQEKLKETEQK